MTNSSPSETNKKTKRLLCEKLSDIITVFMLDSSKTALPSQITFNFKKFLNDNDILSFRLHAKPININACYFSNTILIYSARVFTMADPQEG